MIACPAYDWVIAVQISVGVPGQYFASAVHSTRTMEIEDGGPMRVAPLRLFTGWLGSRKLAIEAAEALIIAYESGIPD